MPAGNVAFTHCANPLTYISLQHTVPPEGFSAGQYLGYGVGYEQVWETFDGILSLGEQGDQVFLYCIGSNQEIHFLAALSYGPTGFVPPGKSSYEPNESALPLDLVDDGRHIELIGDDDNWNYDGPAVLEAKELKAALWNSTLWTSSALRYNPPTNRGGASGAELLGSSLWIVLLTALTVAQRLWKA